MATILNKTRRPLKVPLPGYKILRLAPLKSAEVNAKAVHHPPLQEMVAAGDIEITEEGRGRGGLDGDGKGLSDVTGHDAPSQIRRTGGDR